MKLSDFDIFRWIEWLVATIAVTLFKSERFDAILKRKRYTLLSNSPADDQEGNSYLKVGEGEWKQAYMRNPNTMSF